MFDRGLVSGGYRVRRRAEALFNTFLCTFINFLNFLSQKTGFFDIVEDFLINQLFFRRKIFIETKC